MKRRERNTAGRIVDSAPLRSTVELSMVPSGGVGVVMMVVGVVDGSVCVVLVVSGGGVGVVMVV